MGRKSTIDRLPKEVRELIGELRRKGRTLDEIMEKLGELDVEVSRSSLGRWTKRLDAVGEEMKRSRQMAEVLAERFGGETPGQLGRLNLEIAHSLLMRLMVSEEGEFIQLDPKEAMFLTSALKNVVGAAKSDTDRELQLREKIKAEQKVKLDGLQQEVAEGGDAGDVQAITMAEALDRVRQHLGVG